MIVRKFQEKDQNALIDFNKNVFQRRDEIAESIEFRFFRHPSAVKNNFETLIAEDDKGKLIGQILVIPAEFSYKNNFYPAYFGMDYFVLKENRNSLAGVILVNKFKDLVYGFGIGLNDTSIAIFKAFNYRVVGEMPKYLKIINIFTTIKGLVFNKSKAPAEYCFPDTIKGDSIEFQRVHNPEEIVSGAGYWNHNLVEFSRSLEFVKWRYFYYPEKYFVYKLHDSSVNKAKPTYFVVRPIVWKGMNCLLLVDYRFEINDSEIINSILTSVVKLSGKLKMALTITGSSLPSTERKLKKKLFFKFGRNMEIVTKFNLGAEETNAKEDRILATFADSDCDFYYGNDKW